MLDHLVNPWAPVIMVLASWALLAIVGVYVTFFGGNNE